MMEKNGIRFREIQSDCITNYNCRISDWNELNDTIYSHFSHCKDTIFFIAYLNYKVVFGVYKNKELELPPKDRSVKHIQQIRIFCEERELFLRRKNKHIFLSRLRIDSTGNKVEVVEAYQKLWGTSVNKSKSSDNHYVLSEDRGTVITTPFIINEKDLPIRLLTRNYIGYQNMQAGYVDCRFVKLTNKDKKAMGENIHG